MVPMLTCGLVRSNFAFATGVLLWTGCFTPYDVWWSGLRSGLLAAGLLDDLFRHVPRNLGVRVELHGVTSPALRLTPEVTDVAEHLRERHERLDDLDADLVLHQLDLTTTGVEVADHVAHVVLRGTHLDGHHRLEQDGPGAPGRLLERHRSGDLEGELG